MKATASDGSIHEFPEGTDPSVIDRVMGDYAKSLAAKSSTTQQFGEGMPVVGSLLGKASSAIGAGIQSLTNEKPGSTFGERYDANQESEKAASEAYRAQNPKTAGMARAAGGAVGSVPFFAAGPAGVVGTAATAGALNATDAALGGGDATDIALQGGIGVLTGGVAGGVGKLLAPAAKSGSAATVDQLKAATKQAYEQIRNSNVMIKPGTFSDVADQTANSITKNLGMNTSSAASTAPMRIPKTVAQIEAMRASGKLNKPGNYSDLHEWMKNFGDIVSENLGTQEGAAAKVAHDAIRDFMHNPPASAAVSGDIGAISKLFKETQENYSAMMMAKLIEGKITQAELRSMAAHSGMNLDNTLRQRANDILLNENLSRGLPPKTIEALKNVVKGNATTDALRYVGNLLGGGGGMGAMTAGTEAAITAGVAGGGPLTMAGAATVPVAGGIFKRAANKRTAAEMNAISEALRANAPLSQNQSLLNTLGGGAPQSGKIVSPVANSVLNALVPKNRQGAVQ